MVGYFVGMIMQWLICCSSEKIECYILNIFLFIILNISFGCSNEPSHRDGSFEHSQHMFWLRNMKTNF